MKPPLHFQELNRAREWFNPLRGLDVQRVARLLEEGERGRYAQLQKLYRMAEKRFATLKALKARRLGALKKLDWDVKLVAELPRGFTQAQAEAQQQKLLDAYYAIENLPQAFEHLALPTFRGFAHLEPRYHDDDPSQPVTRLQPIPQWHWHRDDQTWAWVYDPLAQDNDVGGTIIDPSDFIIREIDDPLNEIGLLCFIRANMSAKDWDAFCEDYNIPSLFFSLGENTPSDQVKEWLALAEKVTKNSRGALPPGSQIQKVEAGNPDGAQFQTHMEWQQRELVLAGTGGLLTMLTAAGSGTLAGNAHQEAFDLLAIAEAMEISAVFQAQFDKPLLAREFPSQPVLAYFELAAPDDENLDQLAERLAKLKTAGFTADAKELSEKFGITLVAAAPDPVDGGQQPAAGGSGSRPSALRSQPGSADQQPLKNRAPGVDAAAIVHRANSLRQLGEAEAAALQPVLDRIAALQALPDAEFGAALSSLRTDLPRLFAEARLQAPDVAQIWEQVLATALVDGLSDQPSSKP